MKNVHVLPTDKPSRPYYNGISYKDANSTIAMDWYISSANYKPQNIYITSDEEIKEGDWVIQKSTGKFMFLAFTRSESYNKNKDLTEEFSKIILTTDQDLVKDGVQEIEDEFLKWFVKNPSCEKVETKIVEYGYDEGPVCGYEIIIPKETPKQLTDLEIAIKLEEIQREEPKQWYNESKTDERMNVIGQNGNDGEHYESENLEEAASNWFNKQGFSIYNHYDTRPSFIEGAKWQQERSYSESKVLKLILTSSKLPFTNDEERIQWFEQFKKK